MSLVRLTTLAVAGAFWLGIAPVSAAPAAEPATPVAIAVEAKSEPGRTRLSFTLSRAVEVGSFVMDRPDRVILDLPEVNFQLPAEAGRRREGLVLSYRYGLFAPGRSRVVIELAQPALVAALDVTTRPEDGGALLTVELARVDADAFRNAARTRQPDPAEPEVTGSLATPTSDKRPLIVLDAGHGGLDPGAVASTGAYEKDIVFSFAQRLKAKLEATGRYRVLMTRDQDVFVALADRVRLARAAKADLFISIHADSISAAPQIRGGTVYTGSERATDAESANLADRENKADAVGGLEAKDMRTEVADILQDLTQRETRGFSHRFAKRLLAGLDPVMPMSKKPHREAGFLVLRAPDVPSVLVELGYLSSRKDIDLLTSDAWRDRSAGAMTAAIDRYFGPRIAARETAPVLP